MMIPTVFVESSDKLQQLESKELARVVLQLRYLTDLDIPTLTDGIRTLRSVDEIVVDNHLQPSEPDWGSHVYADLFESIGSIPKIGIVELRCCGRNPRERRFPLALLSTLLTAAQNHGLRECVIFRSFFRGNDEDFVQLGTALRAQTSLQELYAECSLRLLSHNTPEEPRAPSSLARWASGHLLSALARVPTLERLCLHIGDYRVAAPDALVELLMGPSSSSSSSCTAKNVHDLYLYGLYLSGPQLASVGRAMEHNTSIRRLALEVFDMDHSSARVLADTLRTNDTLESFDLHIRDKMQPNETTSLELLAASLRDNTSLKSLELYNSKTVVQERTERAFTEMLQTNTTLKALRLLEPRIERSNERANIDLLLRLNGRGRQRILEDMERISRSEWMDFLAQESYDDDFLYYYLRLNPLLCSCGHEVKEEKRKKEGIAISSSKRRLTTAHEGTMAETIDSKKRKCIV